MLFDHNAIKQSKLTSQILIEHALSKCQLAKQLASELEVPAPRISEWKAHKGWMPTATALLIIDKYGSPESARGVYKPDVRLLAQHDDLYGFLNRNDNYQLSITIQKLIIGIRLIVLPNRSDINEIINDDLTVDLFLKDPLLLPLVQFAQKDNDIVQGGCFNPDESFSIPPSFINKKYKIEDKKLSINDLVDKYELKKELTEPKHLDYLLYASLVFGTLKRFNECVLTSWLTSSDTTDNKRASSELVLTGDEVINEYLDVPIALFNDNTNSNKPSSNVLLGHARQLSSWVCSERNRSKLFIWNNYGIPIHRKLLSGIVIEKIDLLYKPQTSSFTLCLLVNGNRNIYEHERIEPYNLVLVDITTPVLLEHIIPQLSRIENEYGRLQGALSLINTKYKLAELGVLIPGVTVV